MMTEEEPDVTVNVDVDVTVNDQNALVFKPGRHFVCAQCMATGVPDPDYTSMDERYTLGYCMGDHKGRRQTLVREDVAFFQKQKKEKTPR